MWRNIKIQTCEFPCWKHIFLVNVCIVPSKKEDIRYIYTTNYHVLIIQNLLLLCILFNTLLTRWKPNNNLSYYFSKFSDITENSNKRQWRKKYWWEIKEKLFNCQRSFCIQLKVRSLQKYLAKDRSKLPSQSCFTDEERIFFSVLHSASGEDSEWEKGEKVGEQPQVTRRGTHSALNNSNTSRLGKMPTWSRGTNTRARSSTPCARSPSGRAMRSTARQKGWLASMPADKPDSLFRELSKDDRFSAQTRPGNDNDDAWHRARVETSNRAGSNGEKVR